jgi:hypothetical protein
MISGPPAARMITVLFVIASLSLIVDTAYDARESLICRAALCRRSR